MNGDKKKGKIIYYRPDPYYVTTDKTAVRDRANENLKNKENLTNFLDMLENKVMTARTREEMAQISRDTNLTKWYGINPIETGFKEMNESGRYSPVWGIDLNQKYPTEYDTTETGRYNKLRLLKTMLHELQHEKQFGSFPKSIFKSIGSIEDEAGAYVNALYNLITGKLKRINYKDDIWSKLPLEKDANRVSGMLLDSLRNRFYNKNIKIGKPYY